MGDQYQARAELGTWYGYLVFSKNSESTIAHVYDDISAPF